MNILLHNFLCLKQTRGNNEIHFNLFWHTTSLGAIQIISDIFGNGF